MALLKDTNSYATVIEADAYFEDRLDVAAWDSAEEDKKSQALVTATAYLNTVVWIGYAISESQPLAFPRVGAYFDPRVGYNIVLPDTVPLRIIEATYELAYHFLNNDGILDDTGTVTDLTVGQISLKIRTNPSVIPNTVNKIITPLLGNSNKNAWWRAN